MDVFEPIIIKSIIIDNAAKLGANISDKNEANLIYEKIKSNTSWNIFWRYR